MKFDAGLFYRKKYITQKEHVVKSFIPTINIRAALR